MANQGELFSISRPERRSKRVDCRGSAIEAIGPLRPGLSVFGVTRGQFSMIDILFALIDQMESPRVSVWTWAIAEYEVDAVMALLERRDIAEARLVMDYSGLHRKTDRIPTRELLRRWRARHGEASIRVVKNHAKIATLQDARFSVVVRGSMNLNMNPRFEQFDVDESPKMYGFIHDLEDSFEVAPLDDIDHDFAKANSQLGAAWDAETLARFEGGKAWRVK